MSMEIYIDRYVFGLSRSCAHIIYVSFKDKFKERKWFGEKAYVSKKECEKFISTGRMTIKRIEANPYTFDDFKKNFLERYKFYDTEVFSEVYKNFKESLERFEEMYWDHMFYGLGKFRKMLIEYK